MHNEITVEEVIEAGVVFAVIMVCLAPHLYWMTRVKPREASRRPAWALIPTSCFFLGAALRFAALFGTARNALLPSVLPYPVFTA